MVAQRRGGRIVNVTSVHEHVPLPESAAYVAAEARPRRAGRSRWRLSWHEHGITVNAVAPGEIATPMTGNEDVDPRTLERPSIPAGGANASATANQVATLIAHLCTDAAAYITGASYVIDGGLLHDGCSQRQLAADAARAPREDRDARVVAAALVDQRAQRRPHLRNALERLRILAGLAF